MAADVVVRFLADTAQLERGVQGVGSTIKGMARTAVTAFGAFAIGSFASDAVDAANDIAESVSKVQTVFGAASKDIERFADGSAQNLGISRRAALDAAGSYGNMFTQLGLGVDVAADMSKGMLTLTADLASFHNADPTEVIEAQSAAFRGEYDALQKFVPTINAAAVETRALADTGKTNASQLTQSEKALAAYKLMVEGAGSATGDFARTSEGAANQQRIMEAETENATASIGQALQPVLAIVVPMIADMASAFAGLTPQLQTATVALAAFAAIGIAIGGTFGAIVAALGLIIVTAVLVWEHWDEIWTWIMDHPAYAAIILILAAPIAMFVLIVGALKTLWSNWNEIWGWIKQAASDAKDWIVGAFNDVVAFFEGIPGAIGNALSSIYDTITKPFRDAWHEVENIGGGIIDAIAGPIRTAAGIWNRFARFLNGISIPIPSVDLGPLGEIGGGSINLPHVPTIELARGGIVSAPTLALIGEAGPEAVVPLSRGRGFGDTVFNVNVNVAAGTPPAEVGAAIVDAIRSYERTNGAAWRAA